MSKPAKRKETESDCKRGASSGGLFKYFSPAAKVRHEDVETSLKIVEHGETFDKFNIVSYNDVFDAKLIPSNGNCFFAAVTHQLQLPLHKAKSIRLEIVDFIRTNELILV